MTYKRPRKGQERAGTLAGAIVGGLLTGGLGGAFIGGLLGSAFNPDDPVPIHEAIQLELQNRGCQLVSLSRVTAFQLKVIFRDESGHFWTVVGSTIPRQEWIPIEIEDELYNTIITQLDLMGFLNVQK